MNALLVCKNSSLVEEIHDCLSDYVIDSINIETITDALRYCRSTPPSLVIVDGAMQDWELLAGYLNYRGSAPCVLLAPPSFSSVDGMEALMLGVAKVVLTPFTTHQDELKAVLERIGVESLCIETPEPLVVADPLPEPGSVMEDKSPAAEIEAESEPEPVAKAMAIPQAPELTKDMHVELELAERARYEMIVELIKEDLIFLYPIDPEKTKNIAIESTVRIIYKEQEVAGTVVGNRLLIKIRRMQA